MLNSGFISQLELATYNDMWVIALSVECMGEVVAARIIC